MWRCFFALVLPLLFPECLADTTTRPNIVFILADDLGWDDVSFHGSKQVPTPNLDALATDGIILGNYYVQSLCTPSRGALLTGKHPIQIGLQRGAITPAEPAGLGLKEKLLPQYLNTLGYKSHMVGKWHLGMFADEYTPMHRGFKTHYGYYHGREDYLTHTNEAIVGPSEIGLDFWLNGQPDRTGFGQYSTLLFTNKAEQLLAEHNKNDPMFLYLAHQAVHAGNQGDRNRLYAPYKYTSKFSYIQKHGRVELAGMISCLDESVGNLTKALHANGMLNTTIIVFSSDNGAPHMGDDDHSFGSNFPLRGAKASIWDGGMRAPGFIWSPLLKKSGYISKQLMHISDWLPTLLEAAGYDVSTLPSDLYGVTQWQALQKNGPSARDSMLYNADAQRRDRDWALRVGDMKLVHASETSKDNAGWYQPFTSQPHSAPQPRDPSTICDDVPVKLTESQISPILQELSRGKNVPNLGDFVLSCGPAPAGVVYNCIDKDKPCLFNITADPCEYHNLADIMPDVVGKLEARLEKFLKMAIDPINKGPDPAGYPSRHGGVWVPWIKL